MRGASLCQLDQLVSTQDSPRMLAKGEEEIELCASERDARVVGILQLARMPVEAPSVKGQNVGSRD
jgi:hypothetical protein